MAGTITFDLVSPERKLASVQATAVQIPGADGDMTAMEGHTPTITTLRPGVLRAMSAEGNLTFIVTGGFAEITASQVSVLAEQAIPAAEATPAVLDALLAEARSQLAGAADKDAAELLVNEMQGLRAALGV